MKSFLLIAAFLLCCSAVWGQELQVRPGDYNSIQSAIDDANDGDVVIVSAGTYPENIDFLGKAITVRSVDPNDPDVVAATIIDGNQPDDQNQGSVVTFRTGEDNNSTLAGFTITGGTGSWLAVSWEFKGLRWNRCGGGVVCYNMSAPTISKNVFTGNIAGQGGGIYVYGDPVNPNNPSNPSVHISPVITDNTFIDNSAITDHNFAPPDANYPAYDHGDGGAIVGFQGCDAIITGNLIEDNRAYVYGGGIHLRQWSNGLIEGNRIISNDSMLGCGIHITYTSSPDVINNTIEYNGVGSFGGGGIYIYYYSNPTVKLNTIRYNTSSKGAGIAVMWNSKPEISTNLIADNFDGAGVLCVGTAPDIIHNTIANNTAGIYSGGIHLEYGASPLIEHNIVSSNGDGYGIYIHDGCTPSEPTIRFNDIWNHPMGNYHPDIGDQAGLNGNISASPVFADAEGGDYHLAVNSPCINAGDPNYAPLPGEADFEGDSRVLGQYIDIGVDEARPVWNTTKGTQYAGIQEAIDDANDGDTIVVTPGRYYEKITFGTKNIVLRSIEPNDWGCVERTIIDANHQGRAVTIEQDVDSNTVLEGFTITNGISSQGAGVLCYYSPIIRRNIIRNNESPTYKGGGVYFWSSNAQCLFEDNIVKDNHARFGGGMFADTASAVTIRNNLIANNTARVGAGLRCQMVSQTSITTVVGNTIRDNVASDYGGAISCADGPTDIYNNLVVANQAPIGAGLDICVVEAQIVNNTIVANDANQGAGVYFFQADANISNNIVAFNLDGYGLYTDPDPCHISDLMIVHNDVWANEAGNYGGSLADQTGINGNVSVDPNFVDPGYWDDANTPADANDDFFAPGDYHLHPDSPCIDAGDNNLVPDDIVDLDGNPRFIDGDCNCTAIVDMGVYEVGYVGDFDCDLSVNIVDFAIFALAWLTEPGDGQWNPCCDIGIPANDYIDWRDLEAFTSNWLEGTQ